LKHYSVAPVISWVTSDVEANSEKIAEFSDKSDIRDLGEDHAQTLKDAHKWCQEKFNQVYNDDVVTSFKKFDKDNSGEIDKEELGELSKSLGFPLNEEQLELALKDLDMNKDGVVDMEEFKRWYFTGMKPYNSSTRTMLKIGSKTKALMDVVKQEAENMMLS